jgi:hypothetical protein
MRAFAADNAHFLNRCEELLGRMIDTVPSTVQLTEPISPIPVKPLDVQLILGEDGQLRLSGSLRVSTS